MSKANKSRKTSVGKPIANGPVFNKADLWNIYKAMRLYEPIKEEQQRYDLILEKLDKLTNNI